MIRFTGTGHSLDYGPVTSLTIRKTAMKERISFGIEMAQNGEHIFSLCVINKQYRPSLRRYASKIRNMKELYPVHSPGLKQKKRTFSFVFRKPCIICNSSRLFKKFREGPSWKHLEMRPFALWRSFRCTPI